LGCKRNKDTSRPVNLLLNPGFEQGDTGWMWLDWSKNWGPFEISDKIAHSGKKSAYLKLDVKPGKPEKKIRGVVQTLKPEKFPEIAAGWYRVENWKRGSPRQYLQFVVIVWGKLRNFPNYQIRYVLDGVSRPPLRISNAHYRILTKSPDPKTGEWIYFEVPIREDFKELWEQIPQNYEKINFFWEARFDDNPPGDFHIRADVYYDDLYVGEKKK